MSKMTVSPIAPFSARSAASVNTRFAAIAAGAAALDPYNFAEEGIDWRTLPVGPHGTRIAQISETTRAAVAINAVYGPTYTPNGTAFRTGALGNVDANTVLRVTAAIHVQTTLANLGFTAGASYRMRMVWNDGVGNIILNERGFETVALAGEDTWLWEGWIAPGALKAVAWVELQYVNTQIFRPKSSVLVVDKFTNALVSTL